jgi:hypothetical protein
MANVAVKVAWLQSMLKELGVKEDDKSCLWCDNLRATSLLIQSFMDGLSMLKLIIILYERE